MDNKTLASIIKNAREKLGISQRELSRRTGIDNNTIAKIEKGERKKPNILSLRKLSMALDLRYIELMKICNYSKEETEAIANNNYYSALISAKDASILMLEDIKNIDQQQIYIKLILKELLDNCDIDKLNCISGLNKSEKTKLVKSIKEFIAQNDKEIEEHKISISHIDKMLGIN